MGAQHRHSRPSRIAVLPPQSYAASGSSVMGPPTAYCERHELAGSDMMGKLRTWKPYLSNCGKDWREKMRNLDVGTREASVGASQGSSRELRRARRLNQIASFIFFSVDFPKPL